MAIPLVTWLRVLFAALGCVITASVIYTVATDGLPFRVDLLTPWMVATLVDFYINIATISLWVFYKESNLFVAIIWLLLLVCFGSITTCAYVLIQLLKLSLQESLQDPIYHVLLRHTKKDVMVEKTKYSSMVVVRILFGALGFLMLGTLLYTLITDGSPFRKELLTPWMTATLIDFYINVVALSVWIAYKEPNWISAVVWIILLISFGSISTCAYIVTQLCKLTSQDPIYLLLFNSKSRAEIGYDRTAC